MKRYKIVGGVVNAGSGEWVRYEDARAVIDGLQALLNERDAEIDMLKHDIGSYLETLGRTCELLGIDLNEAKNAAGKPSDVLHRHAKGLRMRADDLARKNEALTETHVLYTWLRRKADQHPNDVVAVYMNIGQDWTPVQDLDRDLRTMIEAEQP